MGRVQIVEILAYFLQIIYYLQTDCIVLCLICQHLTPLTHTCCSFLYLILEISQILKHPRNRKRKHFLPLINLIDIDRKLGLDNPFHLAPPLKRILDKINKITNFIDIIDIIFKNSNNSYIGYIYYIYIICYYFLKIVTTLIQVIYIIYILFVTIFLTYILNVTIFY